jgi:hypothetical protein
MESSVYVPVVLEIADDSEPLLKTVSEAVDVKEINIENLNETVAEKKVERVWTRSWISPKTKNHVHSRLFVVA